MAEVNWTKINSSMKRLKKLHDRMDADKDLAYMEGFRLKNYKGDKYLDDVINVTGNYPATFADSVVSDLSTAEWQIRVESESLSKDQCAEIEGCANAMLQQADQYLKDFYKISGGLKVWFANHVCIRGPLGIRWTSSIVDGLYSCECLPIDMRWCAYPRMGLSWVAPILFYNSDDLKDIYPDEPRVQALPADTNFVTVDLWDGKENQILVAKGDYWTETLNGYPVYEQGHNYGSPPLAIVFPSVGFMLRDKDFLEHDGEGIYWKNRKIYPEWNRTLSIQQTLGMNILAPAFEREYEDYDASPAIPVPRPGEVQKVPKGATAKPVPTGDFNRASFSTKEDLMQQIELGGASNAELGSASLDRPGVWFARQFEIRKKLEKPRFDAIGDILSSTLRMGIQQIIDSGQSDKFKIGATGKKLPFKPEDLGDPDTYTITCIPMTKSKEMEIINIAEAQAAKGLIPRRVINERILLADDPAQWDRELDLEAAKALDPAIGLSDMAMQYAMEAEKLTGVEKELKNLQSMLLTHRYVMEMKASMNPVPPEQRKQPTETKADQTALAGSAKLLGAGGMIGGGQANNVTQRAQEVGQ